MRVLLKGKVIASINHPSELELIAKKLWNRGECDDLNEVTIHPEDNAVYLDLIAKTELKRHILDIMGRLVIHAVEPDNEENKEALMHYAEIAKMSVAGGDTQAARQNIKDTYIPKDDKKA